MQTAEVDVDTLEAGLDLDLLIAKQVFNFDLATEDPPIFEGNSSLPIEALTMWHRGDYVVLVPRYSTDIRSAWQVVEYMKSQHDMVFALMNRHEGRGALKDWRADFYPFISDRNRSGYAYGETAPEAIARAALKAVQGIDN